jgi:asparagine synthase (glutamine-hydrolysing)
VTKRFVPSIASYLKDDSPKPTGQSLANGIKRLGLLPEIDPRASILRWSSYFSPGQRQELWQGEHWRAFCPENAQALIAAEFEQGSGSYDRMTMAASLEARSPFLDHELVSWTARLPDSMKLRGRRGKHLLKLAFADYLPGNVLAHRKQGFGIPLAQWFRGPLAEWSRELLLATGSPLRDWFREAPLRQYLEQHIEGRIDHGKRLYALSMLAVWAQSSARP